MTKEERTAGISIIVSESGKIQVNTNLNVIGALHLLASAQKAIIEKEFMPEESQESEE